MRKSCVAAGAGNLHIEAPYPRSCQKLGNCLGEYKAACQLEAGKRLVRGKLYRSDRLGAVRLRRAARAVGATP